MAQAPPDDENETLTVDDVGDILDAILAVQSKSYTFGIKLQLPHYVVVAIICKNLSPEQCLLEILIAFLKQQGKVRPTWRVIINALRSPSVGMVALANKVEEIHILPDPTTSLTLSVPANTGAVQKYTPPTSQLSTSGKEICVSSIADLIEMFEKLKQSIRDCLEKRNIDANEVAYAPTLISADEYEQHKLFLENHASILFRAANVPELSETINLVAEFDLPKHEVLMPETVKQFQQEYASKYNLRDCAMMVILICPSSFIITWNIPVSSITVLKEKPAIAVLRKFSVTRLDIDDVCVYCQGKPLEVIDLTEKKVASNRAELGEKQIGSIPYRSSLIMTASGSKAVDLELTQKISKLKEMFELLKVNIGKSLLKRPIIVAELVLALSSISAHEFDDSQHKIFIEGCIKDLLKTANVMELFAYMSLHWNYLHPYQLNYLVKIFGLEEVKTEMDSYRSELQMFIRETPLALFCRTPGRKPEPSPKFREMVAKYWSKDETETLEVVEQFRQEHTSEFNLQDCAMMLAQIYNMPIRAKQN